MFRAALILSFVSAALGLSSGDLTVSLKAVSSSVKSIEDITLTAVVTNPTDKDLRVIAVNNVLDSSATRSFTVTKDNKEVAFAGIMASFDFSHDNVYMSIPAGQSVAVNHTLSNLFDFEEAGTGSFSFAGSTTFQSAPNDEPLTLSIDPVTVKVTSDVARRPLFKGLDKRVSTPVCSDAGKKQIITDSLSYARSLAGGAATDINSHPNGPEYTRYFGGNTQSDIWYNFDRVAGDQTSSRNIMCSSDYSDSQSYCTNNPGIIAYTVIYSDGRTPIYVCDLFFQAGTTPSICQNGYDSTMSSRGGIILHELSHAVFGAADVTYGCTACAALGTADKKRNADNYRCMGLNIYLDYNC